MNTKFAGLVALSLASVLPALARAAETPIAVADIKRDAPVDFEKEILPVLRSKCLACHNATKKESDLVLESPQAMLKGGATGPGLVAGKSAESLILKAASHVGDTIMPPKKNDVGAKPLTSEELGLLKLWIDQGAKGEVLGAAAPIVWQSLPPGIQPIYAVTMSPNGQYAAAGRANQVFLYHIPAKRELGRLTDPSLMKSGLYDKPGVADFDLIQSLAFNRDSDLLATGGYRTLKLWRRPKNQHKADLAGQEAKGRSVGTSGDGKWIALGDEAGKIYLFDASGKLTHTLAGHEGAVTSVEFSADNSQLYSSSLDKSVRMWTVADGKQVAKLDTPAEVRALRLITKGTQLATGGADKIIRLWALPFAADAKPVKELAGHGDAISALAVVSDTQLASASVDGGIKVWDINSGASQRDLNLGGIVSGLVVRADGKRLIAAGANNLGRIWNLENNQVVAELKGDFNAKLHVDEMQRVVALSKKNIETLKKDLDEATKRKTQEEENAKKAAEAVKTAETAHTEKVKAAEKPVADKEAADKALAEATAAKPALEEAKKTADAAFVKAGEALTKAQQDKDKAVEAANQAATAAKTAADKLTAAKEAAAKDAANADLAAAVTAAEKESADAEAKKKAADEAKVAAEKTFTDADAANKAADQARKDAGTAAAKASEAITQADQKVKQLAAPYQKAIDERTAAMRNLEAAQRTVERSTMSVKTATDALPGFDAAVKQGEAASKEMETTLATATMGATATEKPLRGIALSSDGKTVAMGGDGQVVYTWDTESGVAIDSFSGHAATVEALAYLPDGNLVSVADKTAIVWNTNPEWTLERTIGSPDGMSPITDRVTAIDFSPDGTLVATGSGEPSRSGELKIWKVADGTLVSEIKEPHSDTIYDIEFSPDGKYIASCGADRFMKVFDVAAAKLHRSYEGHTHHVLGVSWRSDGRVLVSSGADNVVKVWNFLTGDQLRTIQGFTKEVTAIAFAGDGDAVVASSGDKTVRMKNAENGSDMRAFGGANDFVYSVASSADGKTIVAGSADGVMLVWNDQGQQVAAFTASGADLNPVQKEAPMRPRRRRGNQ